MAGAGAGLETGAGFGAAEVGETGEVWGGGAAPPGAFRGAGLGAPGLAAPGAGAGVVGDAGDAGTGTVLGLTGGGLDAGEPAAAPGGAGVVLGLTGGGLAPGGGAAAPPGAAGAGRGPGAGGLAPAGLSGDAAGFMNCEVVLKGGVQRGATTLSPLCAVNSGSPVIELHRPLLKFP